MASARSSVVIHPPVGEACISRRISEGRDPYTGARVQDVPNSSKPAAPARRRSKVKPYEGPDRKERQFKDN
jgi:hypothetical protein